MKTNIFSGDVLQFLRIMLHYATLNYETENYVFRNLQRVELLHLVEY